MAKKVLIISTSLRGNSNSEILAKECEKGAWDAGHDVEFLSLLDRLNPLYDSDYRFRDIYMIATAAEDESTTIEKAYNGLQGWVDCFERAELKGCIFGGGINAAGEAVQHAEAMQQAYDLGRNV